MIGIIGKIGIVPAFFQFGLEFKMSVDEMNDENATITYLVIVMTAWNLSHGLFHVFR
jgi:hypothetical protein